jgi:hypothetical protein
MKLKWVRSGAGDDRFEGIDVDHLFEDRPVAYVDQLCGIWEWRVTGLPVALPPDKKSLIQGEARSKEEAMRAAEDAFPSPERQAEIVAAAKKAWQDYDTPPGAY